ncbi:MAG TPA: hypothetical protein VMJ70_11770 [Candidatus Sulfotelmatobacter sp.]|nr:hypothetical protein [Candidatus Sulfotelmatobacter sp.]
MLRDRRFWFLVAVLAALVAVLALPRAVSHWAPAPPANRPSAIDSAAGVARAVEVAPDQDLGIQPRHPEIGFRSRELLEEHFRKHGREFHARSAEEYLRMAQTLRDRRKGRDVVEFVRNDAVTCKFDRESGAFIAYDSDGTIRTYFRPRDGEAYFERQKSRSHEGP